LSRPRRLPAAKYRCDRRVRVICRTRFEKYDCVAGRKVDRFRAVPFGHDGMPLPELNLRPLAQAVVDAVGDMVGDVVREELEHLLQQKVIGGW